MKNTFRISGVILLILIIFLIHSCKKEKIPTLTTASVTNITGTSATCGGTIIAEGSGTVISRGVCWSTGITPTFKDNKTTDGAGAGTFISNMSGLNGATTYNVRAYATNSAGTGYGMVMPFTTLCRTAGTDTINNTLYGTGPYYAYGFSVTTGLNISTQPNPVDVITINPDVLGDGSINMIYFATNNYGNSFFLSGEYSDAASAISAFKALTSFPAPQCTATGDQVMANQIWLYKTSMGTYSKFRIISTIAENRNNIPYAECTFEWVYQPDGSLTFPGK